WMFLKKRICVQTIALSLQDDRTIKQVRNSKYQVYCDLMGKRVPGKISDRHTKASQLIISVDEGCKNSAKMTLR
ncbi:MAG TPA: hypothetical protein VKO63_01055, partial [Chitinispirillaceae bacterium]|nr:hypothetical protein [Chitinispirillaceae bacterium]